MKIKAYNKIPFSQGILGPYSEVEYYAVKDNTAEKVKDADILILRTRTTCNTNNNKWNNDTDCNSGLNMKFIKSEQVQLSNKLKFLFIKKIIGIVSEGNVGSSVSKIRGMKVQLNDPMRRKFQDYNQEAFDNINNSGQIGSFGFKNQSIKIK
ncbi:hypothetical protein N9934_04775 [Desulfosarcina sp.]|nr:hypothetical protein [Desulfosarcina sp.]